MVDVTDGDTIRVRVRRREESVRYIGIDTPESVIPGERPECFGKRAARLQRRAGRGRGRVTLVFGAERRDRYGRLLAYVYLGERFVNAEIVRARLRPHPRDRARTRTSPTASHRLQQAAANAGRGLLGRVLSSRRRHACTSSHEGTLGVCVNDCLQNGRSAW